MGNKQVIFKALYTELPNIPLARASHTPNLSSGRIVGKSKKNNKVPEQRVWRGAGH